LVLPPPERREIRHRAVRAIADPEAPCPLLAGGRCAVYANRPAVCRAHGLPLLVDSRGLSLAPHLVLCPLNFPTGRPFDQELVLDLEPVNEVLSAVNRLLCDRRGLSPMHQSVAEALCAGLPAGGER
jgi:hypothetical protein